MRYEQFRQWLNDLRVRIGRGILPTYRRCGCRVKPFPAYDLGCPQHNPKGIQDAQEWYRHNPEYRRGVHDGREIERLS